jgi:pimeloyl-ACP methyl ester carboxylesterase
LWRDFPLHLAQHCGRCVIAYDRLGFGRSSPRPGTLSPDFIETEAYEGFACLYRQLGLDRFVVLGHSVGGCMAVNCAAAWPHACAGVITESAQAFVDEDIRAGIRAAEQQFARPGPWQRLHQYHGDKTAQVLRAWIDTWLSDGFAAWRLDQALSQRCCPLLALHGDRDEYGSRCHPEHIAARARLPGTLYMLADCGHFPHREQPDAVLGAIAAFLDQIRTSGQPLSAPADCPVLPEPDRP